ncbi:alpha-mannosidase [Cryobacterium roopkundense]|uniref:Alpha-mannosidase n=1 Tax=Cryobacterium roopkundense TaxID=1001240 RepID=A0A099J363_9MICO|nr:glycoside hydrolase family 38 C-terminal domain-containing protein [Cryobacterium roopkundense]KGJ72485.1 alpha-mannosidase [Cryobacterium roopkundense]MBB5642229.1 alpha-mannosidase [Cryobacterium roopkundense]
MHDNSALVLLRITRFVTERLQPAVYRASQPLRVESWDAPGEPVAFATAVEHEFGPFAVGDPWGRPWGTTWFHVTGAVPEGWLSNESLRPELVVDLGFSASVPGFQAEGLVYSSNGMIVKAVEARNQAVSLRGSSVDFFVEAASNPNIAGDFTFQPTPLGDLATAGAEPLYTLRQVDVALKDQTVWELVQDVTALRGLLAELPPATARRAEILRALERCVDTVDPHDVAGTAAAGRDVLANVLSRPANASAHNVHAVGHAHIDSAWLWPVRETVRKVARTFSNVLSLMGENADFAFAASSAQQYAWLKEAYPELFDRVRAAVARGAFVPTGGMWVESDTNMPGGEALARQFVAGKTFFMREFGVEPLEVWLPDSFGYSAALPQIVAAAGSRWFLTQKISWNETNVFPHHTFLWEGIDGTRIFTHFPPVADYNAELSGAELARAERNFAEKGRANSSLVPFGWGDGGGGPTIDMIAAARRTASLEGSPTVELSTPRRFFEAAEAEYADPPVWSGELYLEFHRGTFTSQARTKQGNRRSEHLLREAELWATTAAVRTGAEYPYAAFETLWHTVLLQQFHDILPGSSIAWVHAEAERNYAEVATALGTLIEASARALCGSGCGSVALNAGPYAVEGVAALGGGVEGGGAAAGAARADSAGRSWSQPGATPPCTTPACTAQPGASVTRTDAGIVLANGLVAVTVDADGLFSSVRDLVADREVIPAGTRGNLLQQFRDTPTQWDAWDIDEHHRRTALELTAAESVEVFLEAPARVGVRITRTFGASRVVQEVTLDAGSAAIDVHLAIDWQERQKLLKLAFPLDVHADRAASEIQFGHVFRPTHANTSWDWARFETCAHRWVHVGEPGYGVAVANDSTYGHSIARVTDAAGRTSTTVRLSLLRAPLYPDPTADQGAHSMRVSLRVGAGIPEAVAEGYRLNLPLRRVAGVESAAVAPLLSVDNPAVVVEAVKLAEDRSGDVIVRLYEAHGSRARATVIRWFEAADAYETDLLERSIDSAAVVSADGSAVSLELRPFQLVTLRFPRP